MGISLSARAICAVVGGQEAILLVMGGSISRRCGVRRMLDHSWRTAVVISSQRVPVDVPVTSSGHRGGHGGWVRDRFGRGEGILYCGLW
jgi:hypothetical protein